MLHYTVHCMSEKQLVFCFSFILRNEIGSLRVHNNNGVKTGRNKMLFHKQKPDVNDFRPSTFFSTF